MAGHGPAATIAAVERQLRRGITHMLPTEDAIVAAMSCAGGSACRCWQFTLTATDANRFAIRLARHVTGRPKILVHNHNYHGSVDETFVGIAPDGGVVARRGNLGPPVAPPRPRGSWRSTTSTPSSASSPTATSPSCCSSPP